MYLYTCMLSSLPTQWEGLGAATLQWQRAIQAPRFWFLNSPLKGNRVLWRNGRFLGQDEECTKQAWNVLCEKVKRYPEKDGYISKGQFEEAPVCQLWDNLSINVNNDSNITTH